MRTRARFAWRLALVLGLVFLAQLAREARADGPGLITTIVADFLNRVFNGTRQIPSVQINQATLANTQVLTYNGTFWTNLAGGGGGGGVTSISATAPIVASAPTGAVALSFNTSAYTAGSLLWANGSLLAGLADVTTGSVLTSAGAGLVPSWTAISSVTSGVTLQQAYTNGGASPGGSITINSTGNALALSTGTITTNLPAFTIAETWNNAATTFTGASVTITNTASNAASLGFLVSGATISCPGAGTNSERFGSGASSTGSSNCAVFGQGSTDSGFRNVAAFGQGSTAGGVAQTIVGQGAIGGAGTSITCLGNQCQASGGNTICIGDSGVVVNAANAIGIGSNISFSQCLALGIGQVAANQVAASHQFAIGSDSGAIRTSFIGRGFSSTTPDATVSLGATGGSGAGITGSKLALFGGRAGDNPTAGGEIDLQVSIAGSGLSSTTAWIVSNTGALIAGADNTYDIGDAAHAGRPRNVYIAGKLTVAGAIDPTSVSLSSGTALFFDSADGSTAPLSASGHGRLRYNNGATQWEASVNGGAYASLGGGGTTYPVAPSGGVYTTSAAGTNATALGDTASAAGNQSIAIGHGASTSTTDDVAIGRASVASHSTGRSTLVGGTTGDAGFQGDAYGFGSTLTANGQFVAGSVNLTITDSYFGNGVVNSSASAWTLHGTGGSGADNAGGALNLAGGISTGAGAAGLVNVEVARASGSSSTPNTLLTMGVFGTNGLGVGSSNLDVTGVGNNSAVLTIENSNGSNAGAPELEMVYPYATPGAGTNLGYWRILNGTSPSTFGYLALSSDQAGTTDSSYWVFTSKGHGVSLQANFVLGATNQNPTMTNPTIGMTALGGLVWTNSTSDARASTGASCNYDTGIFRQGTQGVLGLLDPTSLGTACAWRVYGTADTIGGSQTNADWLEITTVAGGAKTVGTNKSGSGTAGILQFATGGTTGLSLDASQLVTVTNTVKSYNGVATTGIGAVPVYGLDFRQGRTSADGAAITLYTAVNGTSVFRITADIFATAFTSGTATYTVAWTQNGSAQSLAVTATALNTLGTSTDLINPDNGTNITARLTGVFTATVTVTGTVEQIK